jgi:hypothetical protein
MELPIPLRRPFSISLRQIEIRRLVEIRRRRRPVRDEAAHLAAVMPKRDVPTSRFVGLPWYQD